ncbi:MAG: complex I NDUFA9 subunit family protein [Brevundimonas sp.]|uniref:complex I NDUFA9 subunit family protein n=1 Tax=Brevundimonas sp. TaxID=1871086 RepID=UPI002735473D|nr:complex I NDUFA9 subunit family protein [Brevundimonas sp.]MDP3403349.1 complex I NDUFA9 subunit family protein [Brevundimonas sp.]
MSEFSPGLVTVFGGSGFVGTQAVRALARDGWRVRVAVRKPALAQDLRILGEPGQIQPVRCDITRPADVTAALKGANAAVNLVGLLFQAPGRSFAAAHVEGARNIAEACVAGGVGRLVQVSAIGADANSGADYGRTKGEAENAARAVKPETVILRPSIVFGNGDGFLNRFADMATTSPALPLIGGGTTKFQPVYVGDVAEAIARSAIRPEAAGRTFELGGPEVWTFKEILQYILRETGRSRILAPIPVFAAALLGRITGLTALIGIAPVLTRDQVLMLKVDNVVAPGADGLTDLGIEPTGLEAIAPSYLWRYRRGGQFAPNPGAVEA